MSENEIVVAPTNDIVASSAPAANSLGITANDIIIPKILLMQAISQAVKDRKVFAGDLLHSINEVKMDTPLEFIVVNYFKEILQYEDDKYIRKEPWTHDKEVHLVREETVKGIKINRTVSHNYGVILTKDIEEMTPFPMVISFKKTGVKAGKKLGTSLLMLEEFGAKPQDKTFKLVVKEEAGDRGTYFVFDIEQGRKTTEIEKKISYKWADRMRTVKIIVDDKDEEVAAGSPSGAPEAAKDVKVNPDIDF